MQQNEEEKQMMEEKSSTIKTLLSKLEEYSIIVSNFENQGQKSEEDENSLSNLLKEQLELNTPQKKDADMDKRMESLLRREQQVEDKEKRIDQVASLHGTDKEWVLDGIFLFFIYFL